MRVQAQYVRPGDKIDGVRVKYISYALGSRADYIIALEGAPSLCLRWNKKVEIERPQSS